MSTPEAEYKAALLRAVERTIGYYEAAGGFQPVAQVAGELPASVGGYFAGGFATGYNAGTGQTVVPFMTDISYPDGPDLLVD